MLSFTYLIETLLFVSLIQALAIPTTIDTQTFTSDTLNITGGKDTDSLPANEWSRENYDIFIDVANWSKVSYCTVLYPIFREGSLSDACPKVQFCQEKSETDLLAIFRPNFKEKTISGTAYVAVDYDVKKIYVVFRGSISGGDWTTDVLFKQCPYVPLLKDNIFEKKSFSKVKDDNITEIARVAEQEDFKYSDCPNCKVHCGVYYAYSKLIPQIDEVIKPFIDKGFQLVVTGHSLGGGYAYLAGIDFLLQGYNPLVVSLSSLRIGNVAWNVFVDEQFNTKENNEIVANGGKLPIPSFTRVYQKTDLVPRLPPQIPGFPKYTHSGLEFVIDKLSMPQTYDDIEYRGVTNNNQNELYEFELSDLRAATIAYQHINTLARMSPPCNDWEI